jgi:hypothetical protein
MESSVIKEYKIKALAHCIIGLIFLGVGVGLWSDTLKFVDSSKAKVFFGLTIVAVATAIGPFINYYLLKKNTKEMESLIVAETDERSIAVRNEAYAKTFSILKWVIIYITLAYTFMFPKEAFVSFAWWSIFIIFLTAMIMSVGIYIFVNKKY